MTLTRDSTALDLSRGEVVESSMLPRIATIPERGHSGENFR